MIIATLMKSTIAQNFYSEMWSAPYSASLHVAGCVTGGVTHIICIPLNILSNVLGNVGCLVEVLLDGAISVFHSVLSLVLHCKRTVM